MLGEPFPPGPPGPVNDATTYEVSNQEFFQIERVADPVEDGKKIAAGQRRQNTVPSA